MSQPLNWQCRDKTLCLQGCLDQHTLLPFWQQYRQELNEIEIIDLSGLLRVDSAGLAVLVHVLNYAESQGATVGITGISDKLEALLQLYNLQSLFKVTRQSSV